MGRETIDFEIGDATDATDIALQDQLTTGMTDTGAHSVAAFQDALVAERPAVAGTTETALTSHEEAVELAERPDRQVAAVLRTPAPPHEQPARLAG